MLVETDGTSAVGEMSIGVIVCELYRSDTPNCRNWNCAC